LAGGPFSSTKKSFHKEGALDGACPSLGAPPSQWDDSAHNFRRHDCASVALERGKLRYAWGGDASFPSAAAPIRGGRFPLRASLAVSIANSGPEKETPVKNCAEVQKPGAGLRKIFWACCLDRNNVFAASQEKDHWLFPRIKRGPRSPPYFALIKFHLRCFHRRPGSDTGLAVTFED